MNFFPENSLVENKKSVYEERTIRLKNDAKVLKLLKAAGGLKENAQ